MPVLPMEGRPRRKKWAPSPSSSFAEAGTPRLAGGCTMRSGQGVAQHPTATGDCAHRPAFCGPRGRCSCPSSSARFSTGAAPGRLPRGEPSGHCRPRGRSPPLSTGGCVAGVTVSQRLASAALRRPNTPTPSAIAQGSAWGPVRARGEGSKAGGKPRAAPPPSAHAATRLVGVGGPEDVAGHGGVGVVGLRLDQVGEVGEVVAVVDEAGDVLRLVLEDEDGGRGAGGAAGAGGGAGAGGAGGHTAQRGGAQQQQHLPGRHAAAQGAAGLLPLPAAADLCHQPGQHRQRGPPVQARRAHIPQPETLLPGWRRLRLRLGLGLRLQGVGERPALSSLLHGGSPGGGRGGQRPLAPGARCSRRGLRSAGAAVKRASRRVRLRSRAASLPTRAGSARGEGRTAESLSFFSSSSSTPRGGAEKLRPERAPRLGHPRPRGGTAPPRAPNKNTTWPPRRGLFRRVLLPPLFLGGAGLSLRPRNATGRGGRRRTTSARGVRSPNGGGREIEGRPPPRLKALKLFQSWFCFWREASPGHPPPGAPLPPPVLPHAGKTSLVTNTLRCCHGCVTPVSPCRVRV